MGPNARMAGGAMPPRAWFAAHTPRRAVRLLALIAALLAVGAAGLLTALGMPPFATDGAGGGALLDGGWQNGGNGRWSGLECADPGRQFRVVPAPGRSSTQAARFELKPGDTWRGHGSARCLAARYDSGERAGQDRYFALSLYVPHPGIDDTLLWELHHPRSLYAIPGCGVAPFALLVDRGGLALRIATGDCIEGRGWKTWLPALAIPGFDPCPLAIWIDVVVHIRFNERADELVEVWAQTGNKQ